MRIALLITLATFATISTDAQSKKAIEQVREVINDAENRFAKFKGEPKPSPDSLSRYYENSLVIDGTIDNKIFESESGISYSSQLCQDWLSKSESIKLLDEWKKKLTNEVGEFKKQKSALSEITIKSYTAWKNKTAISLDLISKGNEYCLVILHISYHQ